MARGNVHGVVVFTRHRGSALLYRLGSYLEVPRLVTPNERLPSGRVPTVSETVDTERQPYITELVHYESFGHPTGESKACRPALVVEICDDSETGEVQLAIFRRNGVLFDRCRHEEIAHLGGTWHFAHD